MRWKFVTIARPWAHPLEAGGGGLWYPVSIDATGRLYAGNSNPAPWAAPRVGRTAPRFRAGPVHGLAARTRCAHRPPALA